MKSQNVAFGLNFILPGAGFLYLRRWKLAPLNLGIALALAVVLSFLIPEAILNEYGRYVALGVSGASGAWAMHTAEGMNKSAAPVLSAEP